MNKRLLKISALSYSNTFPFVFGMRHQLEGRIGELKYEIPAISAERFKNYEVDIALVPVATLEEQSDYKIITNYCIGSYKEVKSVALFSHLPLEQISKIYLDIESRTSVNLVKVLAKKYWKINPSWEPLTNNINPNNVESVVLIGDKTFEYQDKFPYIYDLSMEWYKLTGLPFVFAVWIARNKVPEEIESELNQIFSFGLQHISKLYDEFPVLVSKAEFEDYLNNFIDYNLDSEKYESINLFLKYLKEIE